MCRICAINRNMNVQNYINMKLSARDILQDYEAFIFQQDLVSCHLAKLCKKLFQDSIPVLEWLRNHRS